MLCPFIKLAVSQTADRRPQTAFLLTRSFSIAVVTAIAMISTVISSYSQSCENTREMPVTNPSPCYTSCTNGLFYMLGAQPTNACYRVKGDGMRLHAFSDHYEPMPTIRFSFEKAADIDGCNKERAGRIGIMPPYGGGVVPLPAELYPVSSGNFQEADVFLVSTCFAKDLLLSTNNPDSKIKFLTTATLGTQSERMSILNNGNVGIGKNYSTSNHISSQYPLQVASQIVIGIAESSPTYIPQNRGILTLFPSNNASWYHLDNRDDALLISSGINPTDAPAVMGIQQYGSKVYIGCAFATAELPAVQGKVTISENTLTNGVFRSPIMLRVERRNDATYAASNPYKLISAGDNTNETFVVKSSGKVEIGSGTGTAGRRIPITPDDDYLLSVDGKIVSREAVVTASSEWSDYVFNDDYNLPSLEEVEKQIKTEKHLTDVPSADDVEKHGINLGEMQATLLKKIEELTLYMIKMNKENNELRAEVSTLKALVTTTK